MSSLFEEFPTLESPWFYKFCWFAQNLVLVPALHQFDISTAKSKRRKNSQGYRLAANYEYEHLMAQEAASPGWFRDEESSDIESSLPKRYTANGNAAPTWLPKWYDPKRWKTDDSKMSGDFRFGSLDGSSLSKRRRRTARMRIALLVLLVLSVIGSIAGV
jgi:hypothetical protein